MTPKLKKITLSVSALLLLGVIGSGYVDWRSPAHARTWSYVFHGLSLLCVIFSFLLQYFYPGNRPVPNPLISLFPKPQEPQKENTL
jgi:hypothetical protein